MRAPHAGRAAAWGAAAILVLGAGALALRDAAEGRSAPADGPDARGLPEPAPARAANDSVGVGEPEPPAVAPGARRSGPERGSADAAASGGSRVAGPFLDPDADVENHARGPAADIGAFIDPDVEPPWKADAETVDVGAFLDADAG